MSDTAGYTQFGMDDDTSHFNMMMFMFEQAIARCSTMKLVKVTAVNAGAEGPVGFVDAQPLVNMMDGKGTATPHGIIHNLPYARIQGGANAIIIDPQVGDIGLAICADRDSSSVKANKAQANPGSRRRFDLADAVYIGGILNGMPNQFVEFLQNGIKVKDMNGNTIVTGQSGITLTDNNGNIIQMESGGITITGNVTVNGMVKATGNVTAGAIDLESHVHTGVTGGEGETGPPLG